LLYQEGFNTDGEAATPQRYTTTGRDVYEVPRIISDLARTDQAGPIFWAHNFEVSYVGVPAPTAGRRAVLAWDGAIGADEVTTETWKLIDATVKWLAKNKSGATVVFLPNMAVAQSLADHLGAAGYNVVDDDAATADADVVGDVVVKGPGGADPTRFAKSPKGVLTFSASDHDDMLVSTIGSTAAFEAGDGTIVGSSHPTAGGLTGSFPVATGTHTWNLLGEQLPDTAITVANFVQRIPPTVATLADVDAMAAGTKPSDKTTETFAAFDFSDSSAGDWQVDNAVPGGATGLWGLVGTGKITVSAAGKYSFAIGMDDGARLRIDKDKNGFTDADNVIVEDVAGGHRARYGDATFAAAGTYDFQVTVFNSGGGGDIEVSVSTQANGGDTSAINSGTWELLGETTGNVSLAGDITVTSLVPSGPVEERTTPLLVLLNGPQDTPPGAVFGGGPFVGFEGTGFFGMSAGNKWPYPDGQTFRNLTLRSVNVTGKKDVKLTVALAATFLDFETNDYLDIVAHPNGLGGGEVVLAHYSAPDGSKKYFADITHGNIPRLTLKFQDVTYAIPAGATDLVIEFRAATTWWNEIVGFDNVRITAGQPAGPISITGTAASADNVSFSWTGGNGPFLVQGKTSLGAGAWSSLLTTSARTASIPRASGAMFFRVQDAAQTTVSLYRAVLSGAAEKPNPVTTSGTGIALLAVEGNTLNYLVSYQGLSAKATAAHIHGPATATETAPPFFGLTPVPAFGNEGILQGTQTLTAAQKTALADGKAYVNIHTSANGSGEIRGQVSP
jgi:hypothetical protein